MSGLEQKASSSSAATVKNSSHDFIIGLGLVRDICWSREVLQLENKGMSGDESFENNLSLIIQRNQYKVDILQGMVSSTVDDNNSQVRLDHDACLDLR